MTHETQELVEQQDEARKARPDGGDRMTLDKHGQAEAMT